MAEAQGPPTSTRRARALRLLRAAAWLLARYGPLVFLVGTLLLEVLVPTFFGERPRPQVPPDGFISNDVSVHLRWDRGDADGPLDLEVAEGEPDFRAPVFRRSTRSGSLNLPPLERGRTYYWRVEQDDGAVIGWFRTSANALHF